MVIMKECHVDNFGKISDFDFHFGKGLNVIYEDNSWGKTTFSVFIKSMFYGLEYNTKRKNERKQYDPWQGGVFGGSLTLEINGREYRIERTFGKKDKDDTFALYDLGTGKLSSDYSENIGEELFEIDRDSFCKSIYIPQCSTETEMTDSFHAKIGNLVQVKDDISNYEIVVKLLENKKKEYVGRGKKSRASTLALELSDLKATLKIREELESEVELLEDYIHGKEKELKQIRKERERYNQIYLNHSKKIADTAIYKETKKELGMGEEKINRLQQKYKKEIDPEDIKLLKSENDAIHSLKSQLEFLDHAEIGRRIKNTSDSPKERLDELRDFFSETLPSVEEIESHIGEFNRAEKLKKEIIQREAENDSRRKNLSTKFRILLCLGLGVIAGGAALEFVNRLIGTAFIVTGIVLAAAGVITARGKSDHSSDALIRETEVLKKRAAECEKAYLDFVSHFKVGYQENIINVLMEIKEKREEYEELSYLLKEHRERKEALRFRLSGHMKNFHDIQKNYLDSEEFHIDCLENDFYEMEREKQHIADLKVKIETLEKAINADSGEILSADELNEKLNQFDSQCNSILEDMNRHNRDLEKKYQKIEENGFLEEEIEKKLEELEACKKKGKLIEDTLLYLRKAKERFSERYLGPLRASFSEYVKMIHGMEEANISVGNLDIDIDLNVKYNYGSLQKDRESLSRGYRDLVDLCIRLSLADVMFKNEIPVLILDDPFVNLDEEKTKNALGIIKRISEKYQVIYFTCHPSRS